MKEYWLTAEILFEAGKKGKCLTYSEFASILNERLGRKVIPERGRGLLKTAKYLQQVCRYYYTWFNVLPGSVVVSRKGLPGKGYFGLLRKLKVNTPCEFNLQRFLRFCSLLECKR